MCGIAHKRTAPFIFGHKEKLALAKADTISRRNVTFRTKMIGSFMLANRKVDGSPNSAYRNAELSTIFAKGARRSPYFTSVIALVFSIFSPSDKNFHRRL
jgi:hypothetical protein